MNAYANQHRTEFEMNGDKCIRVWDCIWYAGQGNGFTKRVGLLAEGAEAQWMYEDEMRSNQENC